ncbi:MAG: EamA family transporter [Bacteroidetes bacterium]|nr:EamA family transporter [Bacteroidota bacterium]
METRQLKWFLLLVLALIWGSSFILIELGLDGLNPFQLGSLRIVCAAVFLLLVSYKNLPEIPRHQWKYVALAGLFGNFIPAYFFALAETQISSSVTSILNSLTPVNALILGTAFFGLSVKRSQVIGLIIGLIGTMILILSGAMDHPTQNYWFAGFVLVATMCYATNVNLVKKYLSDLSPKAITAGNFAIMLLPALIILLATGYLDIVTTPQTIKASFFVLLLGVFGTGIANILFYKLIQISSPVFSTQVTYLIPIVACAWGILYGESLSALQLLGAAIILVGVYLTGKK